MKMKLFKRRKNNKKNENLPETTSSEARMSSPSATVTTTEHGTAEATEATVTSSSSAIVGANTSMPQAIPIVHAAPAPSVTWDQATVATPVQRQNNRNRWNIFRPRSTSTRTAYSSTTYSSTTLPPTPPGYNKGKRDAARLFLTLYCIFMIFGEPRLAVLFSAASICTISQGTLASAKNLWWGFVMWTSLPAAIWAALLRSIKEAFASYPKNQGSEWILILQIFGQGTELLHGGLCAMFLWLSYMGQLEERRRSNH